MWCSVCKNTPVYTTGFLLSLSCIVVGVKYLHFVILAEQSCQKSIRRVRQRFVWKWQKVHRGCVKWIMTYWIHKVWRTSEIASFVNRLTKAFTNCILYLCYFIYGNMAFKFPSLHWLHIPPVVYQEYLQDTRLRNQINNDIDSETILYIYFDRYWICMYINGFLRTWTWYHNCIYHKWILIWGSDSENEVGGGSVLI